MCVSIYIRLIDVQRTHSAYSSMRLRVFIAYVYVRACVRECVRVCVHMCNMCVRVCVCEYNYYTAAHGNTCSISCVCVWRECVTNHDLLELYWIIINL